jgi:hypothetical protein
MFISMLKILMQIMVYYFVIVLRMLICRRQINNQIQHQYDFSIALQSIFISLICYTINLYHIKLLHIQFLNSIKSSD